MITATVLISKNEIFREGLLRIFSEGGFDIIKAVRSEADLQLDAPSEEFLVIIDISQSDEAVAVIDRVLARHGSARCIVLADRFNLNSMLECFQHGAQGVLLKSINCSQMVASVRLVALGERMVPSELIDALSQVDSRSTMPAREPDAVAAGAQLSRRELDVLRCLTVGQSNKEIARRLALSEATVKVHVKAILRKLKVANRTQAAMWGTANSIFLLSNVREGGVPDHGLVGPPAKPAVPLALQ